MTVILVICSALVSALLGSVGEGWKIVLETGAGTGLVYILRWYWWRINAWSEISAMATALIVSVGVRVVGFHPGGSTAESAARALLTTAITTVVWVAVTYATSPEPQSTLLAFYRKVHPHARGWTAIAALAPDIPPTYDLGRNLWSWLLGCAMVYCALFGLGHILLGPELEGMVLLAFSGLCAGLLFSNLNRRGWVEE